MAISFQEITGSPKESLNESSGSTAERKFLTAMSTRLAFAQELVGGGYPNFPQARVVAVDLQPWTEDIAPLESVIVDPKISTADYGTQPCLVTVKYGPDFTQKEWPTDFTKPDPIRDGTELRYQIRGSANFLTVPPSGLKWDDDDTIPVPEDVNSVILVAMSSFQFQWDFVDDPPIEKLEGLMGKVNEDEFLGSEAETILFETYEISETFRAAPLNPHTNRVIIQLSKRRIESESNIYGWNHDYREEPAGWAKLLLSDDQPRYKPEPFAGMFS
jgi:hypothetical protein